MTDYFCHSPSERTKFVQHTHKHGTSRDRIWRKIKEEKVKCIKCQKLFYGCHRISINAHGLSLCWSARKIRRKLSAKMKRTLNLNAAVIHGLKTLKFRQTCYSLSSLPHAEQDIPGNCFTEKKKTSPNEMSFF